jgi:hypothetical protein
MNTIEKFKKELFRKNAIPQNSDNEKWFNQIVDDTFNFTKEQIAREVIESIFDYENESGSSIIDFDRTPEDILKIYLETK